MFSVQEERVMKLISLVTGGDDAFGCDYVLVNLTSNLAQLACRRVAMLKEQKHMDDSLVESYSWDANVEYNAALFIMRSVPLRGHANKSF
jgi:hypothetical protein